MILVGQYDSPYVRRVAISLKLAGLQFTRNTASVFADAEEMRRINPLGRIPSLVLDDGEVLIDSAAILDYIDELIGPERALLPARGAGTSARHCASSLSPPVRSTKRAPSPTNECCGRRRRSTCRGWAAA